MSDLAQALSVAIDVAREAGALLREEFHRPGGPRGTGGHAEIDQPAEQFIQNKLLARFPWDYLGEELGYRNNGHGHFIWLVDPNDGTASYLKGCRGSSGSSARRSPGHAASLSKGCARSLLRRSTVALVASPVFR